MKSVWLAALVVVGLVVVGGMSRVSSTSAVHDDISTADVTTLPPSSPLTIVGVSRLMRTKAGIGFDVETSGLIPGNAYTVWVFIDESSASLPGPPGAEAFEIRLSVNGGFATPSGTQRFSGFVRAGDLPPVNGTSVLAVDDGSFDDPRDANISFVVRAHGAPVAGSEYEQTNFINGGCGPNTCVTIQHAVHVGDDDDD